MRSISTGNATIDDYRAALEAALAENEALRNAQVTKTSKTSKSKRPYVFTPFQAAKIMNEERSSLGLSPITPQMIYTYARKNKFIITLSDDGRKQVDADSFYSWMRTHNAKNS